MESAEKSNTEMCLKKVGRFQDVTEVQFGAETVCLKAGILVKTETVRLLATVRPNHEQHQLATLAVILASHGSIAVLPY